MEWKCSHQYKNQGRKMWLVNAQRHCIYKGRMTNASMNFYSFFPNRVSSEVPIGTLFFLMGLYIAISACSFLLERWHMTFPQFLCTHNTARSIPLWLWLPFCRGHWWGTAQNGKPRLWSWGQEWQRNILTRAFTVSWASRFNVNNFWQFWQWRSSLTFSSWVHKCHLSSQLSGDFKSYKGEAEVLYGTHLREEN